MNPTILLNFGPPKDRGNHDDVGNAMSSDNKGIQVVWAVKKFKFYLVSCSSMFCSPGFYVTL